jgi:hypothetical protein
MAKVVVRGAKVSDALALAQLMHAANHSIADSDCTQAQRNAWSPAPMLATDMAARLTDGRRV